MATSGDTGVKSRDDNEAPSSSSAKDKVSVTKHDIKKMKTSRCKYSKSFYRKLSSTKSFRFLKQIIHLFAVCSTMFVCGTYQAWTGILMAEEARHFHLTSNVSGYGTCTDVGLAYDPFWGSYKHYHVIEGIHMERWIAILLYVGAMISPLPTAYFANRRDRKRMIIASNIPFYLSWSVIFLYYHISVIYLSRLLAGIGVGIVYTMCPLYIGDTVHESMRKYVYHIKNIMFTLGMLYSGIISAFLKTNSMLLFHFIVPVISFVVFCSLPPSPYSLIILKRDYLAELTLLEMRGHEFFEEARREFRIERTRARKKVLLMQQFSFFRELAYMFKQKRSRNVLFISTGLAFFQQCTMYNMCIAVPAFISKRIAHGFDSRIMGLCHYAAGALTSVVCMFFVYRVSRRLLLIFSNTGMLLCMSYIAVYLLLLKEGYIAYGSFEWTCIISFALHSAMYSIGMGHVPDELTCGVVPHDMRAEAAGLQAQILSVFMFLVFVIDTLSPLRMHVVFLFLQLLGNFFIFFFVPETKGRTHQDIWNTLQDAPKIFWLYSFRKEERKLAKETREKIFSKKKQSEKTFQDFSEREPQDEKLQALFKKKREEYIMKRIARKRHPSGRLIDADTPTQSQLKVITEHK